MKTKSDYRSIVSHYESCLAEHGDSHKGVDWPNAEDADVRYRVMLDLIEEESPSISLLDFGCGASHLFAYIQKERKNNIEYTGLDLSAAFCELSREKYPNNRYYCIDILESDEDIGSYDYIVMNGVFTEKRGLSFGEMFDYFKALLIALYPKSKRGLAFNVMSKNVDWERDDLFHLPMDFLMAFLTEHLSRSVVIRHDYGLYEYTVYVYRECIDE